MKSLIFPNSVLTSSISILQQDGFDVKKAERFDMTFNNET